MTLREHVRDVLSPLNRHGTRVALNLNREPTYDELVAHYESHVIIMNTHTFEVVNGHDGQFNLFQEQDDEQPN